MKVFKAFIKPFEAPQRSVKKKFKLIFILLQLSKIHGAGSAKSYLYYYKYIAELYFVGLKVLTHFSYLETRLIWMWKKVCKYHVFHNILKFYIFLKKTVTSTRPLPIERMTYRDMFHKNL